MENLFSGFESDILISLKMAFLTKHTFLYYSSSDCFSDLDFISAQPFQAVYSFDQFTTCLYPMFYHLPYIPIMTVQNLLTVDLVIDTVILIQELFSL